MAKRKLPSTHESELIVEEIRVGWECLGKVGRFPKGKTWFYARKSTEYSIPVFSWDNRPYSARDAAEQAAFNRWREMHEMDTTARAMAMWRSKLEEANARIAELEMLDKAAALERLREDLDTKDLERMLLDKARCKTIGEYLCDGFGSVSKSEAVIIAVTAGVEITDLDEDLAERLERLDTVDALLHDIAYGRLNTRELKHRLAQDLHSFGPWGSASMF